jgi:SAM-dependent methyltransferase
MAVELGAGSGQATGQILKRFDRVLAVEPDVEMAALIPSDPRLEIRVERAEEAELPAPLDAAFCATAFHWMDHRVVARKVAEALRPRGVFLAFGYRPFEILSPKPVQALVAGEWKAWRAYVDERLSAWRPYVELLRESRAFASVEDVSFDVSEARTPEAAAGLFLTTSYAAQHGRALGDEEAYCLDFNRRMAAAADGAPVTVGFAVTGALAQVQA